MSLNVIHTKLVLLGESGVGKSSITIRFVKGMFFEHDASTIGAAFFTQMCALDNRSVKFEIWDTAGQERYQALAPMYYRGANAAMVVYDVTSPSSFTRAKLWVNELKKHTNKNLIIYLVGNKCDKLSKVNEEEINKFVEYNGLMHKVVSAKTNKGICEMFIELAYKIPEPAIYSPLAGNNIPLKVNIENKPQYKKCC